MKTTHPSLSLSLKKASQSDVSSSPVMGMHDHTVIPLSNPFPSTTAHPIHHHSFKHSRHLSTTTTHPQNLPVASKTQARSAMKGESLVFDGRGGFWAGRLMTKFVKWLSDWGIHFSQKGFLGMMRSKRVLL